MVPNKLENLSLYRTQFISPRKWSLWRALSSAQILRLIADVNVTNKNVWKFGHNFKIIQKNHYIQIALTFDISNQYFG